MRNLFDKFGRFRISRELIYEEPEAVKEAQKDLIIVESEHDFASETFIYTAMSEEFEVIEQSAEPPLYEIIVQKIKDNEYTRTEIRKVEPGKEYVNSILIDQ